MTSITSFDSSSCCKAHVNLVEKYMKQITTSFSEISSIEDLYQAGMLALVEANHTYNSHLDLSFRVYAARKVKKSMLRELKIQYECLYDVGSIVISEHRSIENIECATEQANEAFANSCELECTMHDWRLKEYIESVISKLSIKQRRVIYLRYYKNNNFKQIGEKLGLCESGAWHAHESVLRCLRHMHQEKQIVN